TRDCLDLIKEMSGVNMVIDGHSHTLLDTTVYDSENKAVRYRQARHHSQYIGIAELKFDNAGNVKPDGEAYDILELDSSIKEDPVFLDSLGIWSKPVQDYDAIIAGYISDDLLLHYPASRSGEFALGNLIADAFLWYGQKYNAQAAIINTGGIREDLNAPKVTMKDIYSVLPFGNTLDIVTVTGRELLDMMSNGVSRVGGSGSGRFPQVSGIRFAYDKSEGEIRWVKIKQGSRFINVNPNNRYKIAVNSYMTTGGDGYVMLQELSPSDKLAGLAPQQQVLADYLNYKSTAENPLNIAEIEDNRIKAYE
ncbi:MAG: hypothetical protein GY855_04725, partial [candidate division Zixibacteria bacterium]|nr:hypothetical protein [candidate division Zixibacteria bacterium]